MNELIKSLYKQASYRIIETNGAPVISTEFDPQKFAELIVRGKRPAHARETELINTLQPSLNTFGVK